MASPIDPDTTRYERVDQGVDYTSASAFVAIGDGRVYGTSGFGGGSNTAIYIKLDQPIVVNGRSYSQVYYAESTPLVKPGQRVKAGDPVMAAGSVELGFAKGTSPLAPLVGGLGPGTQPTQAGQDFLDFVKGGGVVQSSVSPAMQASGGQGSQSPPAPGTPALQLQGGSAPLSIGNIPNAPVAIPQPQGGSPLAGSDLGQLEPPELTQPQLLMPGQGAIADQLTGGGQDTSRLWDLIQQEQNLTPDTIAYAQNVSLGA